jgi:hypothetical protein
MNDEEDIDNNIEAAGAPPISDGMRGTVSKYDKWAYNNVLVDLARQVLFHRNTPKSYEWVERFIAALCVVNTRHLPIKDRIDAKKHALLAEANSVYDKWVADNPTAKRSKKYRVECDVRRQYWNELFEFALDVATDAGFTINIDLIHESDGLR